ncbi:tripeptidyl peptidase A [Flagelloscypha sp. PMI_526]|nr:tripeptidyl peptidase A [Flagelloscypha sp. PMI_526]
MRFNVLHCLSLLATTLAIAPPEKREWVYARKESAFAPRGWKQVAPAPDSASIKLRIALPQGRFDELETHLYEVSDPDHGRYGQHLTMEEVHELVAPHPDHLDTAKNWLAAHGLTDLSFTPASDWIHVTLPIRDAEELLKTTYHVFEHEESGDTLIRTLEYSLPEWLGDAVELIQPTTSFAFYKPARSTISWPSVDEEVDHEAQVLAASPGAPASCNFKDITLKCLAELYKYSGYTPTSTTNSIGITGYLEEYANNADLELFYKDQKPKAVGSQYNYFAVNGGKNDQAPGTAGAEAGLDVQWAFGISYPAKQTFWSTGGSPPFIPTDWTPKDTNEPYADWLDYVLASREVPYAISTSYGDEEQSVPKDYAIRVCKQLAQLGARGVSLMFSSGDYGVGDGNADPKTHKCHAVGTDRTTFLPNFPASCPFVTTVGGTTGFPEVAVSRFYSGSGFSNYFETPTYQKDAVSAYVNGLPQGMYKGLYNPRGRAYPDVSAQGDNYRIYLNQEKVHIGGTSASSPAFTGIVSLLNDVRLKANKKPLGFLNPLIYKLKGKGFNDVTSGHAAGCGTAGFNATKGWDPVTGYGTPNFSVLKEVVLRN